MARHRCIHICIQHRFGTLNRTGRRRCIQWYGNGALGNTRLDDLDSRMGIRAVLFTKHGIHNARISGTPLQSAVAYYSLCYFINQLRADQSSCNRICRWTCIPAGVRYQRTVGNRLLLDCSNRFSCIDSTLHNIRRNEIRTLYFGTANPYPSFGFAYHPCPRF